MFSMVRLLRAFEDELDQCEFRDLQQAGNRTCRLLDDTFDFRMPILDQVDGDGVTSAEGDCNDTDRSCIPV